MLDQGSSFNIISLFVLDALGVPRENMIRQPTEVLGFGGGRAHTYALVNLHLTVRLIFELLINSISLMLKRLTTYFADLPGFNVTKLFPPYIISL